MDLEHNPRTKIQVRELLYDTLYRPVQARFTARLNKIIDLNCNIQKSSHPSFTYRGHTYTKEGINTPPPRRLAVLADTLKAEMDDYLTETTYLNSHELPFVVGYINQVLNISEDFPDYLKLLPEAIHRPLIELMATCPCKTSQLTQEAIDAMKETNRVSISLMKQRIVLNMIQ